MNVGVAAAVRMMAGRVFCHFKGASRYYVICVAQTHHHRGEYDVVYLPLDRDHAEPVTRPLHRDSRDEASWFDIVKWPDGVDRYRFISEEDCKMIGAVSGEEALPKEVTNPTLAVVDTDEEGS